MEDDVLSDDEIPRIINKSIKTKKSEQILMFERDILSIINDIFLTNYWCTRKNMINITSDYIVGINEINEWSRFFNKIKSYDINYIGYQHYRDGGVDSMKQLHIYTIESFIKDNMKPVYDILNIGNGKISLCGGAIISILYGQMPNDYDLFFHSDSVDEINNIFDECMVYLDNLNPKCASYSRSQYVMNVKVNADNFYGDIQFMKKVYKTKEQILFGFDLSPSRLGYNPKDGIFATICGAMAFSMRAFAIDSSTRSKSFGYRLDKYCYTKQYQVLIPQLQNDLIFDDKIEIFDTINISKSSDYDGRTRFKITDYVSKNDDYINTNNNNNLVYLIEKDYANITFSSKDLQIITELPDSFIEEEMINNTNSFEKPSLRDNIGKKDAKTFLDGKYEEFAIAYFIEENDKKADDIWLEKVNYYINISKECTRNIKDNPDKNYYKGWKYLNSGNKYFGQNYPVNTPPSKYYKPLLTGINHDKFQAFMDCRKNIEYISNLPKEIFCLICEYWLKYEVEDARKRLNNLKIEPKSLLNPSEKMVSDVDLCSYLEKIDKEITCDIVFS